MKEKILYCEFCKEETRHLTTEKMGHKRTSYHKRREIKHCTQCNKRTIKNRKKNYTYTK